MRVKCLATFILHDSGTKVTIQSSLQQYAANIEFRENSSVKVTFQYTLVCFSIFRTVHLRKILVGNQLDAQFLL
jgi:hypothetical protein